MTGSCQLSLAIGADTETKIRSDQLERIDNHRELDAEQDLKKEYNSAKGFFKT